MTTSFIRSIFVLLLCSLALSACGFHLRGPQAMPFATIYLGMNPYEDFTASLKQQINSSGSTTVVADAAAAEVSLQMLRNDKEKHILSLNANGTVREYQLRQRYSFRVVNKTGQEVISLSEIYVYRDVSFAEGLELAKAQEDALLYRDMEKDLVQQLMRRLSRAKMPAPAQQG